MASFTINVLVGFATMLSFMLLIAPEYASTAATFVAYLLSSAADKFAATGPLVDAVIARFVVVLSEEYNESVIAKMAIRLVVTSPLFAICLFVLDPGPVQVVLAQAGVTLPVASFFKWVFTQAMNLCVSLGHFWQDHTFQDPKTYEYLVEELPSIQARLNRVRSKCEVTSDRIRLIGEQCRKAHQEWASYAPDAAAKDLPPTWNLTQLDTPKDIPEGTRPSILGTFLTGDWRLQPLREKIAAYEECHANTLAVLKRLTQEEKDFVFKQDTFELGTVLAKCHRDPAHPITIFGRPSRHGFFEFEEEPVPSPTPTPTPTPVPTVSAAPEAPPPEVVAVDTLPVVADEPIVAPAIVESHPAVVDQVPTIESAVAVVGSGVSGLLSQSAAQLRHTAEMMQEQKAWLGHLRQVQSERAEANPRYSRQSLTVVPEDKWETALAMGRKHYRQWERQRKLREKKDQEEHAPACSSLQAEAQHQEEVPLPEDNVQEEHATPCSWLQGEVKHKEEVALVEQSVQEELAAARGSLQVEVQHQEDVPLPEEDIQEEQATPCSPLQGEATHQKEVVLVEDDIQEEDVTPCSGLQGEATHQEDVVFVEEALPVEEKEGEEEEEEEEEKPAEPHRQEDEVPPVAQEEEVTALPVAPEQTTTTLGVVTQVFDDSTAAATTIEEVDVSMMDADDAAGPPMPASPKQTDDDGDDGKSLETCAGAAPTSAIPGWSGFSTSMGWAGLDGASRATTGGASKTSASASGPFVFGSSKASATFEFGQPAPNPLSSAPQTFKFGSNASTSFEFKSKAPKFEFFGSDGRAAYVFEPVAPVPLVLQPPTSTQSVSEPVAPTPLETTFDFDPNAFSSSVDLQPSTSFDFNPNDFSSLDDFQPSTTFGVDPNAFSADFQLDFDFDTNVFSGDFLPHFAIDPNGFPVDSQNVEFQPDAFELEFPADFDLSELETADALTSPEAAVPVDPALQSMDIWQPDPQLLEVAAGSEFASQDVQLDTTTTTTTTAIAQDDYGLDEETLAQELSSMDMTWNDALAFLEAKSAAAAAAAEPVVAQQQAGPEAEPAAQEQSGEKPVEPPTHDVAQPAAWDQVTGLYVTQPTLGKRDVDQVFPPDGWIDEDWDESAEEAESYDGFTNEERAIMKQMEVEMTWDRDHPGQERRFAEIRFSGYTAPLVPENDPPTP